MIRNGPRRPADDEGDWGAPRPVEEPFEDRPSPEGDPPPFDVSRWMLSGGIGVDDGTEAGQR
jgi:hypothetical protein